MTTVASKLTLTALAAVASLAAATTSFAAAPSDDSPSVLVRYDDLNLTTTAGADVLYRRLTSAARQVCPDIYSRDPNAVLAAQRCQSKAVAKAVSEINNPQLALLHAARISHG